MAVRLFVAALVAACVYGVDVSICIKDGELQVVDGLRADCVARASYVDTVNSTGWASLWVATSSAYDETTQAFAAGMAEGVLSWERIRQYWANYQANEYPSGKPSPALRAFVSKQLQWVRSNTAAALSNPAAAAPFWRGMARVMRQFDGLVAGYERGAGPAQALTELDLYLLNAVGDLIDLNKLYPDAHQLRGSVTPLEDLLLDCSAFIRIFPDGSDVAFTHTTWRAYYAMQRIMKTYALAFAPTVVIASSPGLLHSKDDFYSTPDLAVMETTNSVFNRTLFDLYTTPQTALSWQRVTVANQLATNGSYWTELASMYNSGTYNNQWMVLDMNLLRTRSWGPHSVPDHTLWIMEQIPGTTVRRDVSPVLARQGYWVSYNIPYTQEIYNASGYPAKAQEYGDDYVYSNCSRARIFARDIQAVATVADVQRLIRYNDFQNDPLSENDPVYTIAARADLQPAGTGHVAKAFGAVDAKITTARMAAAQIRTLVQSGPTYDQQPPFTFEAPQWSKLARAGVPDTFKFPWVTFDASGSPVREGGAL